MGKLVDRIRISKLTQMLVLESVFVIFISLSRPMLLSFDSYLYLASAKSLFNSDFGKWFHFLREPGYPMFLKAILWVGHNHLWVVGLIQSLLLLFCIHFFLKKVFLQFKYRLFIFSIMKYFLLVLTLGYGNAILQQAVFISFASMASIFILEVYQEPKVRFPLTKTFLFTSLASFFSVILAISFLASITLIVLIKLMKTKSTQDKNLFFVSMITLVLILGPWFFAKSQIDIGINNFQDKKFFWEYKYDDDGTLKHVYRSLETLGGLISATPEIYGGIPRNPAASENLIFGTLSDGPNSPCLNLFPGPDLYAQYLDNYLNTSNNCNEYIQNLNFAALGSLGKALYPLSVVGLVIALGSRVFQNQISFALSIYPLLLLIPYIYAGVGISRLGVTSLLISPIGLLHIPSIFKRIRISLGIQGKNQ